MHNNMHRMGDYLHTRLAFETPRLTEHYISSLATLQLKVLPQAQSILCIMHY